MSIPTARIRSLNALALMGVCAALASSGWAQRGASHSPLLPDPRITPGDRLDVTRTDICTPGYTKKVRDVPQAVKEQAYRNYGITHRAKGEFEVDHLISLEIGGSNSLKNLWPQSYKTQPWNAHVKDKLENELHRLICAGKIDMATAQRDIATDWIAAYKKYFHTNVPLNKENGKRGGKRPGGLRDLLFGNRKADTNGQVWVNLKSGKYFYPGTRYYGKTKEGKYLPETQAIQQGYKAAQEK